MSKKKVMPVFGTAGYLIMKFDDISEAVESKSSAAAKDAKKIVNELSSEQDRMHVYKVIKTKGMAYGKPVQNTIVHVSLGLNGPGKDVDYADALKRLFNTGKFRMLDAHIDAIDDLWDVLLAYK